MSSNLITIRAYSLENKERYNVVLVKCTQYFKLMFHGLQRKYLVWHNRHAGPPNKTIQKKGGSNNSNNIR